MVHGLVTHHSIRTRLRAIRGTGAAPVADPEHFWHTAGQESSPWAERDGVERGLVCCVLDAQNRLSITKLAPALGWADDVAVVLRVEPGRVYVSVGLPTSPLEVASRYVAGRLTLPAAARGRLDVTVGDAVVAVTAGDGQIVLAGGADIAQVVTGAFEVTPAAVELVTPAKRRGVKAAWQPVVGSRQPAGTTLMCSAMEAPSPTLVGLFPASARPTRCVLPSAES
ncbi:hypothetical protein [Cellulomonas terrae]|nr:hypothetical protein [Cellulomonas terrae]